MTHAATTTFFALCGQLAARAWSVFKNRRQFAELKGWTDEQLRDIGLTRSDVRRATALPFYSDPTSFLNETPALRKPLHICVANTQATAPRLSLVNRRKNRRGQLAA